MKVLISSDMEGITTVVSFSQIIAADFGAAMGFRTSPDFELVRRQGVAEINAEIEGALAAGATEIIVNEAHDGMRNFLPKDLNPVAAYISGSLKPLGMVQGVDESVDAVILTGYHAAAGTQGAVLAHTYSLTVMEARINGQMVGESGLNSAVCGHFGAPVVMVAGDDKVNAELKALLGPQLVGVVVKEGISPQCAKHLHPDVAVKALREAAERAVRGAKSVKPFKVQAPIRLEVDLQTAALTDVCAQIPGVERIGKRTVAYTGKDMLEVYRAFQCIAHQRDPFLAS